MKVEPESATWRKLLLLETLSRWSDQTHLVEVRMLNNRVAEIGTLAVGDKMTPGQVVDFVMRTGSRHVLQAGHPKFDHAVNLAALMTEQSEKFFADPAEAFFAHRKADGTDYSRHSFEVKYSEKKPAVMDEISNAFQGNEKARLVMPTVISIADEMYTNAIYNAPTDKDGNRYNKFLSRSSPVKLEDGREAKITVAADKQVLFVYCEDPYGSVSLGEALEPIDLCYKKGLGTVMRMDGDAGTSIGCHMIFEQCSSFFLAIKPGQKTVFGATILLGLPTRFLHEIPKNVHLIAPF